MANEIGINFRVDAQTDGLKRASADFAAFQQKLSSVLGITDPEKAEEYWEEYNSGLEKATKLADQMSMIESRSSRAAGGGRGGGGGGGGGDGGGGGNNVLPFPGRGIFRATHTAQSLISGGSRDAAGSALGAGEDLLGIAGKSLSKLPLAVQGALGAAMLGVGVGIVGNELSKTYESVGPSVMEATAALRRFGSTAKEQNDKFVKTMDEVSSTSAGFGYSLAAGIGVVNEAARGGAGGEANIKAVLNKSLSASRSLGLSGPASAFTDLSTLGYRFKQDDALEVALGGANNTIGSPRAQEQAQALQSIFQDVLSQGIEGDFTELGATQNWLFRVFSEKAAGSAGASYFSKLSGAVRSSTSLSSETDILKFQAAMKMTGGDPIAALKLLEKGFTPELFQNYAASINGSSKLEQLLLVQQGFGLSMSEAEQMLAGKGIGKEYYSSAVGGNGENMKNTSLSVLLGAQETIANTARDLGAPITDLKAPVMKGAAGLAKNTMLGLMRFFGSDTAMSVLGEDKTPGGRKFGSLMTQLRLATGTTDKIQGGKIIPEAASFADYVSNPELLRALRPRMTADDYKRISDIGYSDKKEDYSMKELLEIKKVLIEILNRPVTVEVSP